jgi:hypothetical protein
MIKTKQNQQKDSLRKVAVPGSPGKQAEEEKKTEKKKTPAEKLIRLMQQPDSTYEHLLRLNAERNMDHHW